MMFCHPELDYGVCRRKPEVGQILRPNGGAFSSYTMTGFANLDEALTNPVTAGADGVTQAWENGEGSGINDPQLEFELPVGAVSVLRVWILCKRSGAGQAQILTPWYNVNGTKRLAVINPIEPDTVYSWKNFDIRDGWASITSLKLEVNGSTLDTGRVDIETMYIRAIA